MTLCLLIAAPLIRFPLRPAELVSNDETERSMSSVHFKVEWFKDRNVIFLSIHGSFSLKYYPNVFNIFHQYTIMNPVWVYGKNVAQIRTKFSEKLPQKLLFYAYFPPLLLCEN